MLGEEILAHFRSGKHTFIASMDPHKLGELKKEEVELIPNLAMAHIFDLESGRNLTIPENIRKETTVEIQD